MRASDRLHRGARLGQDRVGRHPRADAGEDRVPPLEDELQELPLPRGVGPAHRPHPADVAHVVAVVRRVVHEHQVAVPQLRVVAVVVAVPDVVGARRGDRPVAVEARPVLEEDVAGHRVELVLPRPRLRAAHRLEHPQPRELRRAPHEGDLAGALHAAQVVQDGGQVVNRGAGVAEAEELPEDGLAGQAPVPGVRGDGGVGGLQLVAALRVAFGGSVLGVDRHLRVADGPGGPHVGHRADLVHADETAHELGVLGGQDLALRPLQALVARGEVECRAPGAAVEQQVRAGRLDPAEVVEGVRLPGELEAARERRALGDGDRLVPDPVENGGPARAELLGREVGLVVLRRRHGGTGERHGHERSQATRLLHAALQESPGLAARATPSLHRRAEGSGSRRPKTRKPRDRCRARGLRGDERVYLMVFV